MFAVVSAPSLGSRFTPEYSYPERSGGIAIWRRAPIGSRINVMLEVLGPLIPQVCSGCAKEFPVAPAVPTMAGPGVPNSNSSCQRRWRIVGLSNPVGRADLRQLDTSNGCQDHTALPCAATSVKTGDGPSAICRAPP